MRRGIPIVVLVAGVVCAGIGVALNGRVFAAATFGWTAYSPLVGASYQPVDVTWLVWGPRIGLALLAVGAGTAGAAVAALVLGRGPADDR